MREEELPETEEEWREKLSRKRYRIMRKKGTEPRGTGEFIDKEDNGIYVCGACGQELFDSETKFPSSGWPSFYDAIEGSVEFKPDSSHGMQRTEVICSRCESHLGHVFDDSMKSVDLTRSTGTSSAGSGPDPAGKRFCINSASLDFEGE